ADARERDPHFIKVGVFPPLPPLRGTLPREGGRDLPWTSRSKGYAGRDVEAGSSATVRPGGPSPDRTAGGRPGRPTARARRRPGWLGYPTRLHGALAGRDDRPRALVRGARPGGGRRRRGQPLRPPGRRAAPCGDDRLARGLGR